MNKNMALLEFALKNVKNERVKKAAEIIGKAVIKDGFTVEEISIKNDGRVIIYIDDYKIIIKKNLKEVTYES